MSFLSRKPARPGSRGSGAGRDDEYDNYDGYASDGYANSDDAWSPGEYFSPEGIKGRWAGEHPEGRSGGRGGHEAGQAQSGGYTDGFDSQGHDAPYSSGGYGTGEYAAGAYDLPDGADENRAERGARRKRTRDREDRGERTGILRLRRDRGEDIWPDDGISDEDYWASVAADRPLNAADDVPGAEGGSARAGGDQRATASSRFGGDQRGGDQRGAGRLGPPPGLAGDYQPGGSPVNARATGGQATGAGRTGSGPMPARTGSGPMPARSGTGPQPARSGSGPYPTVGVTSSRPPSGQGGTRAGSGGPGTGPTAAWPAQSQRGAAPGPGSGGFPQAPARPSFQPNGYQPDGGQASGRQQDRSDWDRTERIERVNADGYPDPRPAGRSQAARSSGPLSAPVPSGASGGGRADSGSWQAADRREPGRREADRDGRLENSGPWPAAAHGGPPSRSGAEDDPLTSTAYSRAALTDTDGRSYRAAARRSQAQAKLTETFITGQSQDDRYPAGRAGEYPGGPAQPADQRTGEYRQYRGDAPAAAPPSSPGPYPAYGGTAHPAPGRPAQAGRGQTSPGQGTGQGQGRGYPAQYGRDTDGRGLASGPYGNQQPRPSQQQGQPQSRQPATVQIPAAQAPAAPPPGPGSSGGRGAGSGGANPYDTSSYPYPGQPSYAARPPQGEAAPGGADDRYYRPPAADGYPAGSGDPGRAGQRGTDQDRAGYGAGYGSGYPVARDTRY